MLLVFVLAGCLGMAAAEDQAASITLTMQDDNKTVTSTAASSGSADISWETGKANSNTYRLYISGQLPTNVTNPQLTIRLAEGMRFQDDAADLSDRVTLSADYSVENNRNSAPAGYAISDEETNFKNTGYRTYDIQENLTSFTESILIAQHELFRFSKIDNAIEVTLTYQSGSGEVSQKAVMHVGSIGMVDGADKRPQMLTYDRSGTVSIGMKLGEALS